MSEPKSAYELAMERLRKKDAEAGVSERVLSEAQKAEIAEIRRTYDARLAQEEIMHKTALMTTWDPDARAKLDDDYRRERVRLSEEREHKIEKVRNRDGAH